VKNKQGYFSHQYGSLNDLKELRRIQIIIATVINNPVPLSLNRDNIIDPIMGKHKPRCTAHIPDPLNLRNSLFLYGIRFSSFHLLLFFFLLRFNQNLLPVRIENAIHAAAPPAAQDSDRRVLAESQSRGSSVFGPP